MKLILLTIQWPWTKYGCCPSIDLEGSSYWQIACMTLYFSHVSLCVFYAFAVSFILSNHSNRHDFRLPASLLISRSLCDLLAAGFARVDVEDTASSIKPYGRSTWFFFKNGACRLLLQKRIQVALLPGLSVSSWRTSKQIIQHHVKSCLLTTRPTRIIPCDTMGLNPFLVPISGPPVSSSAAVHHRTWTWQQHASAFELQHDRWRSTLLLLLLWDEALNDWCFMLFFLGQNGWLGWLAPGSTADFLDEIA